MINSDKLESCALQIQYDLLPMIDLGMCEWIQRAIQAASDLSGPLHPNLILERFSFPSVDFSWEALHTCHQNIDFCNIVLVGGGLSVISYHHH